MEHHLQGDSEPMFNRLRLMGDRLVKKIKQTRLAALMFKWQRVSIREIECLIWILNRSGFFNEDENEQRYNTEGILNDLKNDDARLLENINAAIPGPIYQLIQVLIRQGVIPESDSIVDQYWEKPKEYSPPNHVNLHIWILVKLLDDIVEYRNKSGIPLTRIIEDDWYETYCELKVRDGDATEQEARYHNNLMRDLKEPF